MAHHKCSLQVAGPDVWVRHIDYLFTAGFSVLMKLLQCHYGWIYRALLSWASTEEEGHLGFTWGAVGGAATWSAILAGVFTRSPSDKSSVERGVAGPRQPQFNWILIPFRNRSACSHDASAMSDTFYFVVKWKSVWEDNDANPKAAQQCLETPK